MNSPSLQWLGDGPGRPPQIRWSFVLDAPLQSMAISGEAGTLLAADQSGGLYLFDRQGKILSVTRGFQEIRSLAFSRRGTSGVAILGENRVVSVNVALKIEWSKDLNEAATAAAVSPFGEHYAVALANGMNYILRSDRKQLAKFETERPIHFAEFLETETDLVVSAQYGFIGRYTFQGVPVWQNQTFSNVGQLAVTANGSLLALAMFSHGIQKYNRDGETAGRFALEGTPHLIAMTPAGTRMAIATLENHLYWIDEQGKLLWAASAPETIRELAVGSAGENLFLGLQSGRILNLYWNPGH
ncbi:MAG: hypothetical protein HUJ26_02400 [Planctomycetaceae bacterium]|nr:hypothetical protein [Planctomycetaceae bacterium]